MFPARSLTAALVVALALAMLGLFVERRASEAQPSPVSRTVLALYDSSEAPPTSDVLPARSNLIHTLAEMPLNYLGLRLEYLDVHTEPLPTAEQMQRYLGIITWFGDDRLRGAEQYLYWLQAQIQTGKRVVILGGLGAAVDGVRGVEVDPALVDATYAALGLQYSAARSGSQTDNPLLLAIRRKVPEMVEFERTLDGELFQYEQFRSVSPANRVYLTITRLDRLDGDSDVVVTGPWGGFVLSGYEYYYEPRSFQKRWRINPFLFFEDAFGIQGYPRPDVSTLNGSRVFYTHIDGDGFNNISEIDYVSLSAELLLQRFIKRYELPFTVSIVVNDIDPAIVGSLPGLRTDQPHTGHGAGALAAVAPGERQLRVARELFAQPNVEPASHTYTHPFDWAKTVDIDLEIKTALDFLNERVAAPGRPVQIVLWSGATNPREEAVARADEVGLLNINGGDGRFDAAQNSYTNLAPLTTQVGKLIQFYTSNANDNIYGNDWTGPYYGLRNVIQTWERTESPRRIGAMNVYYHIFTAEKHAAVRALEETYDYALARDIAPLFTTEYVRLVQGFLSTELVREAEDSWLVRHNGALRTMRFDDEPRFPDLDRSHNVLGFRHYQGALYVFLGEAPDSRIVLTAQPPRRPYLALGSHRVVEWRVENETLTVALEGIGRKTVVIGNLRPETEFTVVEQAEAQRVHRLRSDAAGQLTWRTAAGGRERTTVRLVVSGALAASAPPAGPQ
jgi:hypothetical protein